MRSRRCGLARPPDLPGRLACPVGWGAVQPFERLRAIARHGGDDRLLVAEAADCLGEFDDDPAALVVTCRRLLHHHADRALARGQQFGGDVGGNDVEQNVPRIV